MHIVGLRKDQNARKKLISNATVHVSQQLWLK